MPFVAGLTCFAVAAVLAALGLPEGGVQVAWLACMALAGVAVGRRRPEGTWVDGFVVAACQLPVVAFLFVVTGELEEPARSTGGAAGLALATVFVLAASLVPIGTAAYGRRLARGATSGRADADPRDG